MAASQCLAQPYYSRLLLALRSSQDTQAWILSPYAICCNNASSNAVLSCSLLAARARLQAPEGMAALSGVPFDKDYPAHCLLWAQQVD